MESAMPTLISRFSSVDWLTAKGFFFTTKTNRRPFSVETVPRGTDKTLTRSWELILTFTLIFGSNSKPSLLTAHNNSPTLRVPRGTTCFGTISVRPAQVRFGRASQVIFTGSFCCIAPTSCPPQTSDSHIVTGLHRQRIQRAIGRCGNATVADFFFQRRHFALRLLHLQYG